MSKFKYGFVALLLCAGCTRDPLIPNIFIGGDTIVVGGPSAVPSPSPSPGGKLPEGSRIAVLQYGQTCPSGVTVPKNGTRECKMGCTCDWTCTPKGPDGTDLPESVHGPTATWAVLAGSEHINVSRANFNLQIKPVSLGTFTISCTVKDLTGTVDGAVVGVSN